MGNRLAMILVTVTALALVLVTGCANSRSAGNPSPTTSQTTLAEPASWPMLGHNPQHTGRSEARAIVP